MEDTNAADSSSLKKEPSSKMTLITLPDKTGSLKTAIAAITSSQSTASLMTSLQSSVGTMTSSYSSADLITSSCTASAVEKFQCITSQRASSTDISR